MQYVGKSETAFNLRLNNHRNHIKRGVNSCELSEHFLHNSRCHDFSKDQAADRLNTDAETIQLVISDIEDNNDLTDVTSILNMTLMKVRNLRDRLQQYRNEKSDSIGKRAYSSLTDSRNDGPGCPYYVIEEDQIHFFLRGMHFRWKKIANLLGVSESTLRGLAPLAELLRCAKNWAGPVVM